MPDTVDTLPRESMEAIVRGEHGDPFSVLGPHQARRGERLIVRGFLPGARRVWVVDKESGQTVDELERRHDAGFFSGPAGERGEPFPYRLRVRWENDVEQEIEDPYAFPTVLGEMDIYLLAEGTHLLAHEKMGAHRRVLDGVEGTSFVVWAPNARRVSVVGGFNRWDGRRHPMRRRVEAGLWEIFLPNLAPGELYKYEILGASGALLPLKSDPYAFAAEHPPNTASQVYDLGNVAPRDTDWTGRRRTLNQRDQPIAIYEVHLGSWRRKDGNRYLGYLELADELAPYVGEMGFTHIELLPVSEHPFDGSWGYQPIGLFAPTSRFGPPQDFRAFVQRCHDHGIGVLMDWVPGHFPTDSHGLAYFDGTHLYEHADPRQGFHTDWSTLIYNYGRREVANYLLDNAMFWIERYDIDGLRVDAVASMLYLDYSRRADEWIPNRFGGRENLEAIDFLRRMNQLVCARNPGATTAAEESTAWPMVSHPTEIGGLGFGYKWNMGWMHDTLVYMAKDPIHRKYHHNQLTFGLLYAFSENFILPLSHDEVVHGKGSLLGKMPGDRWRKFANLRAYFGFMWTHPGKKLLFMGGEFAQEREWTHDHSLDWHLLDDPMHAGMRRLVRDLNHLYRATPALYERDCEPEGFEWIDAADSENSVVSYVRRGRNPDDLVVVVCNFTPVVRHDYRIGVPRNGWYAERLNTDAAAYGGGNVGNGGGAQAEDVAWHGRPASLSLTLPPLATLVLQPEGRGG